MTKNTTIFISKWKELETLLRQTDKTSDDRQPIWQTFENVKKNNKKLSETNFDDIRSIRNKVAHTNYITELNPSILDDIDHIISLIKGPEQLKNKKFPKLQYALDTDSILDATETICKKKLTYLPIFQKNGKLFGILEAESFPNLFINNLLKKSTKLKDLKKYLSPSAYNIHHLKDTNTSHELSQLLEDKNTIVFLNKNNQKNKIAYAKVDNII